MVKKVYTEEERELHRQEQHALMEGAIESLTTEAGFQRWLKIRTTASLRRFSFYNQMMILAQKPDATLVHTFASWLKQERRVKRGEHGIWVLKPIFAKVKEKNPLTGEENEVQKLVGFNGIKEFDISQTDGEPVDIEEFKIGTDMFGIWTDKLIDYAHTMGWIVEFHDGINANGYCRPSDKKIVIKDGGRAIDDQVRTLVHEIAHAHDINYETFTREDAEIIVETTACIVLMEMGLTDLRTSAQYIASWSDGDIKIVKARASLADKIADKIEQAIGLI